MTAHSIMQRRARFMRAMAGYDENPSYRGFYRRDLTSEEMRLARTMARDPNCTYQQIADALKWTLTLDTLKKKLHSLNIHCMCRSNGKSNLLSHIHRQRQ